METHGNAFPNLFWQGEHRSHIVLDISVPGLKVNKPWINFYQLTYKIQDTLYGAI